MPSFNTSIETYCPFYMGEGENRINCESAIPGVVDKHIFNSMNQKMAHQRKYCHRRFPEDCPYYQMANEKYN